MGLYSLSKGILIPSSVDTQNPDILYFPMLVRDGGGGGGEQVRDRWTKSICRRPLESTTYSIKCT